MIFPNLPYEEIDTSKPYPVRFQYSDIVFGNVRHVGWIRVRYIKPENAEGYWIPDVPDDDTKPYNIRVLNWMSIKEYAAYKKLDSAMQNRGLAMKPPLPIENGSYSQIVAVTLANGKMDYARYVFSVTKGNYWTADVNGLSRDHEVEVTSWKPLPTERVVPEKAYTNDLRYITITYYDGEQRNLVMKEEDAKILTHVFVTKQEFFFCTTYAHDDEFPRQFACRMKDVKYIS